VRVLELRREADLSEKPLTAEHGGELGAQHLERDRRSCFGSRARYTVAIPPWPSSRSIV